MDLMDVKKEGCPWSRSRWSNCLATTACKGVSNWERRGPLLTRYLGTLLGAFLESALQVNKRGSLGRRNDFGLRSGRLSTIKVTRTKARSVKIVQVPLELLVFLVMRILILCWKGLKTSREFY